MKVLTTLRKLSDLDVKFVSLVDRGANRIPFRIIKSQEKDMSLDLSKLGFRVKKAAAEAEVAKTASLAAVILSTSSPEIIAKAQAALEANGIPLSEYTEFEDGTVALHKEDDAFADGGTIVRLNESVAVVLKDMGKHLDNLKKSAFGEQAETNGYFDGPAMTLAASQETIRVGMQKADTPSAASTFMRDNMEGVNQYLGYLTEAMPSAVLKVEPLLESVVLDSVSVEKAVKKPVDDEGETPAKEAAEAAAGGEDGEPKKAVTCATKEEVVDEEVLKAGMSEAEKAHMSTIADAGEKMAFMRMTTDERAACMKTSAKKAEVVAENNGQMEQVLKAMSDMAFAVATLTKNVGVLSADITQIKKSTEEKIDVLAKKAETATTAVRGTVLASDLGGDPQPVAKIKKTDSDPRTGVFDTALLGRVR